MRTDPLFGLYVAKVNRRHSSVWQIANPYWYNRVLTEIPTYRDRARHIRRLRWQQKARAR
jgi:hypothetical protein